MMSAKQLVFREIARCLAIALLAETFLPIALLALTGGPSQPEFSSFTPVSTSGMVDENSGSFSYNLPVISIPGPNGMGYALSLSYQNTISVDAEASWVGLGWTLNPGNISRQVQGYPDDYSEAEVIKWNKSRPNWTASATKRLGIEFFSKEEGEGESSSGGGSSENEDEEMGSPVVSLSGFTTNRYNNTRGYSYTAGISLGAAGIANVDWSETDGTSSFSANLSPMALISRLRKSGDAKGEGKEQDAKQETIDESSSTKEDQKMNLGERLISNATSGLTGSTSLQAGKSSGTFGVYQMSSFQQALSFPEYTGITFLGSIGLQCDLPPNTGLEGGVGGSYSVQTTPQEGVTKKVYGYIYSDRARSDKESLMDYSTEKDVPYNKRDKYLYIPFSAADQFLVSGEGVGGGFRAYQRMLGNYRPAYVDNHSSMYSINLDMHLCGGFGLGGGGEGGWHSTKVQEGNRTYEDPEDAGSVNSFGSTKESDGVDEPIFFRFASDLGGSIVYGANDDAVVPEWNTPSDPDDQPRMFFGNSVYPTANNGGRVARGAYIGYNLNADVRDNPPYHCQDANSVYGTNTRVDYKAFAKEGATSEEPTFQRISQYVNPGSAGNSGIAEFGVVKQNGMKYHYGLPVYSTYETDLQYDLLGLSAGSIENNFIAYKHVSLLNPGENSVIGEERKTPYATTYLLTEILSPDYTDRTDNGPTLDDLGGFVRFDYARFAGSTEKSRSGSTTEVGWQNHLAQNWYKWRSPYRGLHYKRRAMSDPIDDGGTVRYGYKELYYLSTISTKTHQAVFYTSDRDDGMPAEPESRASITSISTVSSSTEPQPTSQKRLQKLDKIELYARNSDGTQGELLQTVHFEYDYSLCRNLPNSATVEGQRVGKLTLKRMWFESQGVHSARIAPYQFHYEYAQATDFPTGVNTSQKYSGIVNFASNLTAADQNPDYSPHAIDSWGNYQSEGNNRYDRMQSWVDQTPPSNFDPAAWQLKRITLPSGGEIHVQYEQNDYRYVQYQPAMVLAPLKTETGTSAEDNIFVVDTKALGLTDGNGTVDDGTNGTEDEIGRITDLKDQIYDRFVAGNEHLYTRFLYSLRGDLAQNETDLDLCRVEYITGYVAAENVTIDGENIKITLQEKGGKPVTTQLCLDYLRSNRAGVVRSGGCEASSVGIPMPEEEEKTIAGAILKLFIAFADNHVDTDTDCRYLSFSNSYVRLPVVGAKKGGGIRVKRILLVDRGLEALSGEDAAMYGTEYEYVGEDGLSSGVASNEPAGSREENPLVGFMNTRSDPNDFEEALAGEDREQHEGPLGETLLPGPSVRYSRVVSKNIHQGKTGAGYSVLRFFTTREYPTDLSKSLLPQETDGDVAAMVKKLGTKSTSIRGGSPIGASLGIGIASINGQAGSKRQGYRFVLSAMDGMPMSIEKYAGVYGETQPILIESTTYEYFQPGELLPVMTGPDAETDIELRPIGKEEEMVCESRSIADVGDIVNVQADGGAYLAALFPLPFVSIHPSYQRTFSNFNTHVTTRVIRYPAIQRAITVVKDGIMSRTENTAFDPMTGQPLMTQTTDGYHGLVLGTSSTPHDGTYYSVKLPAYRYYEALGQIAATQGMVIGGPGAGDYTVNKRYFNGLHTLDFSFSEPGSAAILESLTPGDLIDVYSGTARYGIYHISAVAGNRVELRPASYSRIDDYPLRAGVTFRIVRSGRTNQPGATVGSFTTYGKKPTATPITIPNQ